MHSGGMALTITDTLITSDVVPDNAELRPSLGGWAYWGSAVPLGARVLNRNEAITAMTLAETLAPGSHWDDDKRRMLIESFCEELDIPTESLPDQES